MNEARCSVNWKLFAPNGDRCNSPCATMIQTAPGAARQLPRSLVPARLQRHRAGAERRRKAGGDQRLRDGRIQKGRRLRLPVQQQGRAPVAHRHRLRRDVWRTAVPARRQKWEASAAPERAEAEKKGFLIRCPPSRSCWKLRNQMPKARYTGALRVLSSATQQPAPDHQQTRYQRAAGT